MDAAEVAAAVGMVAECLDAEDYDEHEGITEESIAEVMSWFEIEIKLATGANALPPPPAAMYYATVNNGAKESCGPSLSGPASTMMASVDGRHHRALLQGPQSLAEPWPVPEAKEEGEDDEWVLQLLTDGPPVEGQ